MLLTKSIESVRRIMDAMEEEGFGHNVTYYQKKTKITYTHICHVLWWMERRGIIFIIWKGNSKIINRGDNFNLYYEIQKRI